MSGDGLWVCDRSRNSLLCNKYIVKMIPYEKPDDFNPGLK